MTTFSLGKITDTAGAATTIFTDRTVRACLIRFRSVNANTGIVSVGLVGFTPGGAGMIGEILKPSGISDEIVLTSDQDELTVADYQIKPATNGDGVYVSYQQR